MLKLTWPILMGQMGHMLIGAGDVFVAGRHSAEMVAAVAIANSFSNIVFIFFLGLLLGISPVLSKKRGEGEDSGRYFFTCVIYALVVSLMAVVTLHTLGYVVPYVGIEEKLVPMVQDYISWFSWSFIGAFVYFAVREFLQAREEAVFVNIVAMVAVLLNLVLNFFLVFGYGALPAMGLKGLAVASVIVRVCMMLVVLVYAVRFLKVRLNFYKAIVPDFVRLGVPTAFAIFIEVTAFCGSTLIIARIDTLQTAAHNIVLILASITYMIPLSVAVAASVKVAHAFGESDWQRLRGYVRGSLILSLGFMGCAGLCFFLFPRFVLRLFTFDEQLITMAAPILLVAALFQIFDGAQGTLFGILRGLHVTKPAFIAPFLGYWVLGIPLGVVFAHHFKMGALGMWIGLAIGLFVVTVILGLFLWQRLRKLFHDDQDLKNLSK